jgi:hypothetical protein
MGGTIFFSQCCQEFWILLTWGGFHKLACLCINNAIILQILIFCVVALCSTAGGYHILEEHATSVFIEKFEDGHRNVM